MGTIRLANGTEVWSHFCAGSIISMDTIITAGHCIGQEIFFVRAGSTYSSKEGSTSGVRKTIRHPKYDKNYLHNDIAIVKLSRCLEMNENTRPAILVADCFVVPTKAVFTVIGWGRVGPQEEASDQLLQVKIPQVSAKLCQEEYPNLWGPTKICAGESEKGTS